MTEMQKLVWAAAFALELQRLRQEGGWPADHIAQYARKVADDAVVYARMAGVL